MHLHAGEEDAPTRIADAPLCSDREPTLSYNQMVVGELTDEAWTTYSAHWPTPLAATSSAAGSKVARISHDAKRALARKERR
jgi:hypothetical protein